MCRLNITHKTGSAWCNATLPEEDQATAIMRKLLVPRTHNKLGDRSFSSAGPRLWNDLPSGLRRPGLTFDSFRQSLKSHLSGDLSAQWLFWIYRCYINKFIYLSIHPSSHVCSFCRDLVCDCRDMLMSRHMNRHNKHTIRRITLPFH